MKSNSLLRFGPPGRSYRLRGFERPGRKERTAGFRLRGGAFVSHELARWFWRPSSEAINAGPPNEDEGTHKPIKQVRPFRKSGPAGKRAAHVRCLALQRWWSHDHLQILLEPQESAHSFHGRREGSRGQEAAPRAATRSAGRGGSCRRSAAGQVPKPEKARAGCATASRVRTVRDAKREKRKPSPPFLLLCNLGPRWCVLPPGGSRNGCSVSERRLRVSRLALCPWGPRMASPSRSCSTSRRWTRPPPLSPNDR